MQISAACAFQTFILSVSEGEGSGGGLQNTLLSATVLFVTLSWGAGKVGNARIFRHVVALRRS